MSTGNHRGHGRNECRSVLIIRVEHDENVSRELESFPITGFLVGPIPLIARMLKQSQSQLPGFPNRIVLACVIDQQNEIKDFERHLVVGSHQCCSGVTGRSNHRNPPLLSRHGYFPRIFVTRVRICRFRRLYWNYPESATWEQRPTRNVDSLGGTSQEESSREDDESSVNLPREVYLCRQFIF